MLLYRKFIQDNVCQILPESTGFCGRYDKNIWCFFGSQCSYYVAVGVSHWKACLRCAQRDMVDKSSITHLCDSAKVQGQRCRSVERSEIWPPPPDNALASGHSGLPCHGHLPLCKISLRINLRILPWTCVRLIALCQRAPLKPAMHTAGQCGVSTCCYTSCMTAAKQLQLILETFVDSTLKLSQENMLCCRQSVLLLLMLQQLWLLQLLLRDLTSMMYLCVLCLLFCVESWQRVRVVGRLGSRLSCHPLHSPLWSLCWWKA